MNEKALDKLTHQEIKERIERNEITLDELDNDRLAELMNHEIDMICLGEGDMDLISRCTDILNKREKPILSKEEFKATIEKARKENIIVKSNITNITLRKAFKRALIAIAAAFAILASTVGIAYAFDFDILKYIAEIVRQPEGTKNNVDGYTFYNNGETKEYSSVYEMIEKENYDIMYPTKWPEGIEVTRVITTKGFNGNDVIMIMTNEVNVNFEIEFSNTPISSSNKDIYTHNKKQFYIKDIEDEEMFCASCFYNNKRYYISAHSREDLMLIINNLQE